MTNTPMIREDVLLDLYKIYAYNPNDAVGNPLTPFGNFCAGYEACQAQQAKTIVELVEALEMADEAMMWDIVGEPMPSKEIEARNKIKEVLAKVKGK